MKRFVPFVLATVGLILGLLAINPHEAFAACNFVIDPACNAWTVQVTPPRQQTVGQNNLNILVTFTNSNPYSVTFHSSTTQASADSYNGAPTTLSQNVTVNPEGSYTFPFTLPANYFSPANFSPGTYPATFNASFLVTAESSINLVSTTQTISAPPASFEVIVGSTSTGPTNPGCIPGVTCSGAPPPVQTLTASMTLQATTPGGQDEPAGTAKFGDKITATMTATSPSPPPSFPPPPPPDGNLVSSSFAWTGPTTIQSGTLNFPGIQGTETNIQSSPSTTTGTGTGTTTAFSSGGGTKDTTNTLDNMSAQYGGAPADSWCYNSLDLTCASPNVAQFEEHNNPGEGQLTFLEDTGGWPPGAGQQGTAYSGWNNGGSGWPVTANLTVTRSGIWTYNYMVCPPKAACFPVTINVPVTVQADETASANFTVTGTNRWELSVWEGGNGLP